MADDTKRNTITRSISFEPEVDNMLEEMIWQATLANGKAVSRSEVVAQLVKDAWAQAATQTKQS